MKFIRKIVFLLIICIEITNMTTINAFASATNDVTNSPNWPKGPSVTAESAILMDANTGTILFEKRAHEELYPASITKILTTLIALENCNLSDVVTFSINSVYNLRSDSSKIYANVGEKLTVEQCLYAIMLASAGDCSNGIAEYISGSNEAFAELMNKKAKDLGCQNTHFVNPHGMPDKNHYTSAYDMALITKAALQNEQFRKITGTKKYVIPPTNLLNESRYLTNHHKMLIESSYTYEGCEGGKTGYTDASGNTLVTYAKRGDIELICVILKDAPKEHYMDTAKLFDWGFENFKSLNISSYLSENQLSNYTLFDKAEESLDVTSYDIDIDKNSSIIIPKAASFDDIKPTFIKNKDSITPSISSISYTYAGKEVGSVTVEFTRKPKYETKNNTDSNNIEDISKEPITTENHKKIFSTSFSEIIFTIFIIIIISFVIFFIFKRKG